MTLQVFLTPDELAVMLAVKRPTVLAMAKRGQLPEPIQIGPRVVRFRISDLETRFGFSAEKLAQFTNQELQQ